MAQQYPTNERLITSNNPQEMIVSVVFMAEHVTKKVMFNLNMKGMFHFFYYFFIHLHFMFVVIF